MDVYARPGTGPAPDTGGPAGPPDRTPDPVRRRGRMPALLAGAAALGLISGLCAGYLVQAGREPTKLPPLSQPRLDRAAGEASALPAARDREARTDGDLRRLLLKKPDGARAAEFLPENGWMSLLELADTYDDPADAYSWLLSEEFRRAAVVGWTEGGTRTVEIRLLQFRQEEVLGAQQEAEDAGYQHYWDDIDTWAIPGTGDGKAYTVREPRSRDGASVYEAEAHAWRGDVSLQIWMYDTRPIPKKAIVDLAKRQMERL
ncbi:hypothetical protein Srubr_67650 [Streptomyces rubradiris]|uniref:Uncharacterized protein n=1 Tax=Streptomyces rubradiris TaxID=285531 RepID=A0ABQ3RM82_STRRR|nr:hypothetical protein GCM10018792_21420 [Streptomyces rubradiris]GHI56919.1 hypothetical protein Srubr_67650 [Streptomyces rubradiris]